jgi:heme A synthase
MPFYGQTWFLSIMSGLISVVLYYLCIIKRQQADSSSAQPPVKPALYIGVFTIVTVLVYGSFVISESTGNCRFIDAQPDIQTGSTAPF